MTDNPITLEPTKRDFSSIGRQELIEIIKAQNNVIEEGNKLIEVQKKTIRVLQDELVHAQAVIKEGENVMKVLAPDEFQDPCRFCNACKMGVYHMCENPTPK